MTSTTGSFENGALTLSFDEYGTKVEATLKDGRLEGQYSRGTRGAPYPFQAKRFAPAPVGDAPIPPIAGLWNIQVGKSSKGEAAWQLIVRQSGAEASAAILRVDGDTGTLTGTYRDGKFVLSHFSGARPLRLELTPASDGTLSVVQNKDNPFTAVRADQARAKGLPQPSDPSRFTSVKDPTEPFRFSFPDLNGKRGFEHRREVPRQGRHRQHLAAAGARTATTRRRSSASCTRNTGAGDSRSSACRSRKKRS